MPTVESPQGTRHVKDLGWLRRHAGEVRTILLTEEGAGEATLVAFLSGERTYRCTFASFAVARAWITRPSLRGARQVVQEIRR